MNRRECMRITRHKNTNDPPVCHVHVKEQTFTTGQNRQMDSRLAPL